MLGQLPVGQYFVFVTIMIWQKDNVQDHIDLHNWYQGTIFLAEFGFSEN